jgi:hypothetical protein
MRTGEPMGIVNSPWGSSQGVTEMSSAIHIRKKLRLANVRRRNECTKGIAEDRWALVVRSADIGCDGNFGAFLTSVACKCRRDCPLFVLKRQAVSALVNPKLKLWLL